MLNIFFKYGTLNILKHFDTVEISVKYVCAGGKDLPLQRKTISSIKSESIFMLHLRLDLIRIVIIPNSIF